MTRILVTFWMLSVLRVAPRYADSIRELCDYVALPTHLGHMDDIQRLQEERVCFLPEAHPRWQHHLQHTAPVHRHDEVVKRRVATQLMWARYKKICLHCWLPEAVCICEPLLKHQCAEELRPYCTTTIVVHPEEFLRCTNTGHVAAMLLDAPLLVWGVPRHNAAIASLGFDVGSQQQDVILYPAERGSITLQSLAAEHVTHSFRPNFVLSDGTWGQARNVNRHVPDGVPRVRLDIPPHYDALFAPLRKRTRETGVSTLEATLLAVSELTMLQQQQVTSEHVRHQMIDCMKLFVSSVSLYTNKSQNSDSVDDSLTLEFIERCTAVKANFQQRETRPPAQLPPPVLNYCYSCDNYVRWNRMAQHVGGDAHQRNNALNPTGEPSIRSRDIWNWDSQMKNAT